MKDILKNLGPGLLYAAAAIGVSHLVQSTRAGASFGYQLLWAVALANILKYPFFAVGPTYTAVTGKSLLEGYRVLGKWTIPLFFMLTIATMFTVQAAVTIVTAGISLQLFNLPFSAPVMSLALLIVCSLILIPGKFNVLDNLIKVIIIILTLSTIISITLASVSDFSKTGSGEVFSFTNNTHIFFLMALVGWMPAPMDIPVWHSLWSVAKNKERKINTEYKHALNDFRIGYIGTALLASCFLILGARVMYQSGEVFSPKAAVFAGQLIELYTRVLGNWSFIFIAVAAFTTMFSTTLTCLDAFPRILTEAYRLSKNSKRNTYTHWLIITIVGTAVVLFQFLSNMKALVDFATILSFVVAPIFAYLNFKVMTGKEIPSQYRMKTFEHYFSIMGIICLSSFSLYFLYLKFIR